MTNLMNLLKTKRKLGSHGPLVSNIGLGCFGLTFGKNSKVAEEEKLKVLNQAIDLGCNFFDTSDIYGFGENEKLISKVLKERRDEVFLCSKFGFKLDPITKLMPPCGTKEYVRECCLNSLGRLQIDYIDLYYQHRVDPNTPIEETVEAMAELVNEGKVRYLGLSECSAKTLRRAHKVHPIAAVQVEYSLMETSIETNELLDTCKELGISIVAYSPMGRGFLNRKINPDTLDGSGLECIPRFQGDNMSHNLMIVTELEKLALKYNCSLAQLCIGWILKQGDDFIPIPGASSIAHLEDNFDTLKVQFPDSLDNEVRSIVNKVGVKGERLPPESLKEVDI